MEEVGVEEEKEKGEREPRDGIQTYFLFNTACSILPDAVPVLQNIYEAKEFHR